MNYRLKSTLILFFSAMALVAEAQQRIGATSDTTLSKKLDDYLESTVSAYHFNGSVLIARKGEILLQKGYGWKDVARTTVNDERSIFPIGSLTKPFTAEVILKLQEQGKLSIHDHFSKYFPDYPKGDKITLEELLDHTSGIHNYTDDIDEKDTAITLHPVTKERVLDAFIHKRMEFKPGTKFSYNNSAYYLLGWIIEKVSGKPYETMVRETIFNPLGMIHSGFDFTHLNDTCKTIGYRFFTADRQVQSYYEDSTVYYAAGAMYSTTGDLYKWAQSIAAGEILTNDSWKDAFTARLDHYGLGWWIDSLFGKKYIAHSGGRLGYMSNLAYYPAEDVTIILLNNFGDYGQSLVSINQTLSAIVFDQPYTLWGKQSEIHMSSAALLTLAGTYKFNAKHSLIVTAQDGKLYVEASNPDDKLPRVELHAETSDKFYITEAQLKFEFVHDAQGNTVKMITYNTAGKDVEWLKVK